MNEEAIYDEGFYEGLRVAWSIMFGGVLAEGKDFQQVLKELANARDNARADAERHHEEEEDECICSCDEMNPTCPGCF